MFIAALFEGLLFRGIIQNLLLLFIEHQWITIIITTLLFLGIHTPYFKKPIILFNIAVPCLTFGWMDLFFLKQTIS
ncbi:CPBP family glutamic-type intramembrane protease [Lysinibacillus sp. M3]|uniref:CPBP family glutamic-type intramembrane protease n=1 Tax=Lysinibacillus zambalensis TaxID=3160866 RepID=A0ABV1MLA2_9BACI